MENKIEFSDDIKRFKHFTKIDDNTWYVQCNKDSVCESYYVTVLVNAIVMYGDYDGVIVKPNSTSGREELINWMVNATSLNYFCEKVFNGNQYHKCKEFSSKVAKESILDMIMDKFDLSKEMKDIIKKADNFTDIRDDLINRLSLEIGCHPENVERDFPDDYEKFEEIVIELLDTSFYHDFDYFEFCENHDFYDFSEYPYEEYTSRIRLQHQCLLWWANMVNKNE